MVVATRTLSAWARYAWAAGILNVVALVAETVVGVLGGGLSQNGSAAKIANTLLRPPWAAGGGHIPIRRLCRHVSDLPVQAV